MAGGSEKELKEEERRKREREREGCEGENGKDARQKVSQSIGAIQFLPQG